MDTRNKQQLSGITAILTASLLWGTTGTAATFAPEVSPVAIGAAAMGFGGLLQALLAMRKIQQARITLQNHLTLLCLGALGIAVYPLAFYSSIHLSGVAIGTVVSIGAAPLFSALLEKMTGHFHFTKTWMIGMTTGLAGIALLASSESSSVMVDGSNTANLLGILCGLIAALTYAFYSWAAHRLITSGASSGAAMGSMFGLGGLLLMPVLYYTGAPLLASSGNLLVGIYMAMVPMGLGYICFGFGLAYVKASLATTLTLTEPVVATVLAVFLVGEELTSSGLTGILLIFICLYFLTRTPKVASEE
ncbi:EamA family transporter [Endozoicomonas sp. OPT23]|nr:EamA family transporter [Endozoicomonas sp. OPT23]